MSCKNLTKPGSSLKKNLHLLGLGDWERGEGTEAE